MDIHGIDLSKSAEVHKFADDVLAKYKNVDILVNNAGMGTNPGGPIEGELTLLACLWCWTDSGILIQHSLSRSSVKLHVTMGVSARLAGIITLSLAQTPHVKFTTASFLFVSAQFLMKASPQTSLLGCCGSMFCTLAALLCCGTLAVIVDVSRLYSRGSIPRL